MRKENNNWKYSIPLNNGHCLCTGELPISVPPEGETNEDLVCDFLCQGNDYEYCGAIPHLGDDDGYSTVRVWVNPSYSAMTEYPPEPPLIEPPAKARRPSLLYDLSRKVWFNVMS